MTLRQRPQLPQRPPLQLPPRLLPRLLPLLLLLLLSAGAGAQQLLLDGGFTVDPGMESAGVRRVTGADVFPFPGPATVAALQLMPAEDSRFVIHSSTGDNTGGWYRCTGWTYATAEYNGGLLSPELTIELVDAAGTPLAHSRAYTAALGSAVRRSQWIHFDEWVPSNVAGSKRARLTFAPGHLAGFLQLAQLSVTFESFGARESYDIEPLAIYQPEGDRGDTTVSCSLDIGLPARAECPESWGAGSQLAAVDDDRQTSFYASHVTDPIVVRAENAFLLGAILC